MKVCPVCSISFAKKTKYCSKECQWESMRKTKIMVCVECGSSYQRREALSARTKFCSQDCANNNRTLYTWDYFFKWKNGIIPPPTTVFLNDKLRMMLIEEAGFTCSICMFSDPHPVDGSSILEINHIDGDGSNHLYENLEVLCPNHHTLTDTYRARNKGNGRKVYYRRVSRE